LFNQQQLPAYTNSTLYLNSTNTSTRQPRQHQRSNSILNGSTSINSSSNPFSLLNATTNFSREFGGTGIISGGLRNSARAMSSTSFSTNQSNPMNRDPSSNSIKSLNPNTLLQQQNTSATNSSTNNSTNSKLNFIKDLQIRLMDMQKECYFLRCELDTCQQKLTSSLQSIKQFWSPELKRERLLRKEETTKYNMLLEQYKLLQQQYQSLLETYEQQTQTSQQLQLQLQQMQQMQQQYTQDELNSVTSAKNLLREKNLLKTNRREK
jgi:hypothetical protein